MTKTLLLAGEEVFCMGQFSAMQQDIICHVNYFYQQENVGSQQRKLLHVRALTAVGRRKIQRMRAKPGVG